MLAAVSWWESGSAVFVAAPTLELGAVVDGRRHLDRALLVQQQRGCEELRDADADVVAAADAGGEVSAGGDGAVGGEVGVSARMLAPITLSLSPTPANQNPRTPHQPGEAPALLLQHPRPMQQKRCPMKWRARLGPLLQPAHRLLHDPRQIDHACLRIAALLRERGVELVRKRQRRVDVDLPHRARDRRRARAQQRRRDAERLVAGRVRLRCRRAGHERDVGRADARAEHGRRGEGQCSRAVMLLV